MNLDWLFYVIDPIVLIISVYVIYKFISYFIGAFITGLIIYLIFVVFRKELFSKTELGAIIDKAENLTIDPNMKLITEGEENMNSLVYNDNNEFQKEKVMKKEDKYCINDFCYSKPYFIASNDLDLLNDKKISFCNSQGGNCVEILESIIKLNSNNFSKKKIGCTLYKTFKGNEYELPLTTGLTTELKADGSSTGNMFIMNLSANNNKSFATRKEINDFHYNKELNVNSSNSYFRGVFKKTVGNTSFWFRGDVNKIKLEPKTRVIVFSESFMNGTKVEEFENLTDNPQIINKKLPTINSVLVYALDETIFK